MSSEAIRLSVITVWQRDPAAGLVKYAPRHGPILFGPTSSRNVGAGVRFPARQRRPATPRGSRRRSVCASGDRRRPAGRGADPPLRLVPERLARASLRVGDRTRAGSGRGRLPRRLDHAGVGGRPRAGLPRRQDRQSRHQRRHVARRPDQASRGRARAEPGGRGAAHRHQRSRGGRDARDRRGQPHADPRGAQAPQPADAGHPVRGVSEFRVDEAPGRSDQGGQRALPGGGQERRAGHPARDLAVVCRPGWRRVGQRVSRPAPSQRRRLHQVGGGAQADVCDVAARGDHAGRVHAGRRIRKPVQRPRPDGLGLSSDDRRATRRARRSGRRRIRTRRRGRSSPSRSPSTAGPRRPTGASSRSTAASS